MNAIRPGLAKHWQIVPGPTDPDRGLRAARGVGADSPPASKGDGRPRRPDRPPRPALPGRSPVNDPVPAEGRSLEKRWRHRRQPTPCQPTWKARRGADAVISPKRRRQPRRSARLTGGILPDGPAHCLHGAETAPCRPTAPGPRAWRAAPDHQQSSRSFKQRGGRMVQRSRVQAREPQPSRSRPTADKTPTSTRPGLRDAGRVGLADRDAGPSRPASPWREAPAGRCDALATEPRPAAARRAQWPGWVPTNPPG